MFFFFLKKKILRVWTSDSMLKTNVHLIHRDWNQYLYHLFLHPEHTLNNKQLLSQTFRINSFYLRKMSLETPIAIENCFLLTFQGKKLTLKCGMSVFSQKRRNLDKPANEKQFLTYPPLLKAFNNDGVKRVFTRKISSYLMRTKIYPWHAVGGSIRCVAKYGLLYVCLNVTNWTGGIYLQSYRGIYKIEWLLNCESDSLNYF